MKEFEKWNNRNGGWLPICDGKDWSKRQYAEPEREESGSQAEPNPSEAEAPPPPPPKKLPDLIISSLSVFEVAPGVVAVEVTVSNIGDADAGPFNVTISEQVGGNSVVRKSFVVPGLPAGGSFSWGETITLISSPPHLITAFADALYEVEESNENNNAKQVQIT